METIKEILKEWDLLGFVVAAIISLIIGLVYNGIKNLVTMKRKPFNISKQTISRMVYDNRKEGGFIISVSYKGKAYDDSLTMLRIRLLNDGENDINYIRQCAKPISIEVLDAEIIDVFIEPSSDAIEASVSDICDNQFDLSWSLLKKDEYLDLVIVAKGKDFRADQVSMEVRAEGIDEIKSPEYRIWPQLGPVLAAACIWTSICWFFMPNRITYIPGIAENVFWASLSLIVFLLYTIYILVRRIRWQKE